jgi:Ca2+-binding RTX toxin-like protein
MPTVTASVATNLIGATFSNPKAPSHVLSFLDNVNKVSAQGTTYTDAIRSTYTDQPGYRDFWLGPALTFNAGAEAPTGGTVTGYIAEYLSGGVWRQAFAIEGLSIGVMTLYNAAITSSTTDDAAVIATMFAGSDTFNGSPFGDGFDGHAGNDTLRGGAGNDTLRGGSGNDRLDGGTGADTMAGGSGNDLFIVDVAGDVVAELSGGGTDTVRSGVSRTLGANQENLVLTGTAAMGTGNAGANSITGNGAANTLSGGAGRDLLLGGLGNDLLRGGTGLDTLTGGGGLDTLRFDTTPNSLTNADRVTGFVAADDRLQFENAVFTALGAAGPLPAAAFRLGAVAGDASDRLLYQASTGALRYDPDGTGPLAPILVATFTAGTTLTLADLFVV